MATTMRPVLCPHCGAQVRKNGYCSECYLPLSMLKKAQNTSNYYYNIGYDRASARDLSGAIESLLQALRYNKRNVPARNLSHDWFYRPAKPNYVFKRGEFVFIALDGAKETIPGTNGYYRESTLKWFDNQLTKYANKKVVVFQHFPILPPTEEKSHQVYRAEDYVAILKKHDNVIAIVSGHYHLNKEKMDNGIYHISSPSLVGVTNPYKIIDIVTTKGFSPMIYTQLREVGVK